MRWNINMILQSNTNLITKPYDNDPTNRWLPDITNAQHHSMKAISATKIKDWLKMSDHAWHAKHVLGIKDGNSVDDKQKKAFAMGTVIHLAVGEPEKFETSVVVCDHATNTNAYKDFVNERFGTWIPEFDPFPVPKLPEPPQPTTTDGAIVPDVINDSASDDNTDTKKTSKKKTKAVAVEVKENKGHWYLNQGKNGEYYKDGNEYYVVKSSEMEMLRRIQKNVASHPLANKLIKGGVAELSGVARDPETGLYMNIRGDNKGVAGGGYFIDFKSINSCSYNDIQYAIETYNYPIQHAHYLETANLIDGEGAYEYFAFLFVAKEQPNEVVFVTLDPEDVERAAKFRRNALRRIAQCEASGKWGSIDNSQCMTMKLNKWYGSKFKA